VADLRSFKQDIQSLVRKFEQDKNNYLQKGYPEAQVRIDFLNPFIYSLRWQIENKAYKPHHESDVFVELSLETSLWPDYTSRINGNTKFFVEAKAPWVSLDDVNDILQAKTYAFSNCICK
jgi:predicted type IV restriction endonuclease